LRRSPVPRAAPDGELGEPDSHRRQFLAGKPSTRADLHHTAMAVLPDIATAMPAATRVSLHRADLLRFTMRRCRHIRP
jgi:hypothetical protein